MENDPHTFKNTVQSKILFLISTLVFLYWLLTRIINVYDSAIVGAIFEFLWLPMLAMLFVLPILSWAFFWKERFNVKSLYLYSVFIVIAAIIIVAIPR